MRERVIEIAGKDTKLVFTTRALRGICAESGGDIKDLAEWLIPGADGMTEKVSFILSELANAAVIRARSDGGGAYASPPPKKAFFSQDFFFSRLSGLPAAEILEYVVLIFEVIEAGMAFEIPKNLNIDIQERDAELAELEALRRKRDGKKGAPEDGEYLSFMAKALSIGLDFYAAFSLCPGEIIQMWLYLIKL